MSSRKVVWGDRSNRSASTSLIRINRLFCKWFFHPTYFLHLRLTFSGKNSSTGNSKGIMNFETTWICCVLVEYIVPVVRKLSPWGFEISISNKFQSLVTIWQKKLKIQQKKLKIQQKNSRFNKKNSRTQNRLLGKCAARYLLPICPDKLPGGCSSIFSRKYDCAEKKNSRIKKKNSRYKKNSRISNRLSGKRAVGYLLPIGPDKLSDGCSSIFSRKYDCAEKKTQEPRKKTQGLKKTQETQITCLGTARLVTCCQLVQTSSRMVVVRYFRENTVVLRKKLKNQEKKLKILKKTQESQIACLGSARLVTCSQLVQTSSRMVVDRYFHPGACLDQLGASNQPRFEILEFFLDLEFFSHDSWVFFSAQLYFRENIDLQPFGSLPGPIGSK